MTTEAVSYEELEMKVPGREIRRMFDYVRDDVLEATNKRQQPFTY